MGLKASRVGTARLGEVVASGRVARTAIFIGKALPAKVFRFSVLSPKKTFPDASTRNRVRRRCREAFGVAAVSGEVSVDLIVTPRPEALSVDFKTLVSEASELLGCYSTKLQ